MCPCVSAQLFMYLESTWVTKRIQYLIIVVNLLALRWWWSGRWR